MTASSSPARAPARRGTCPPSLMRYILPLQDNTVNVEPEFYEDGDDSKWDGVFTYKKRVIWFRKRESGNRGNSIYTFRDDSRRAEMPAASSRGPQAQG